MWSFFEVTNCELWFQIKKFDFKTLFKKKSYWIPFYPEYNSVSTIRIRLQKVIKCLGLGNILNWKFE